MSKAQGLSLNYLAIAVIALIVIVVVVAIFTNQVDKTSPIFENALQCKGQGGDCFAEATSCPDDGTSYQRVRGLGCEPTEFCCIPRE